MISFFVPGVPAPGGSKRAFLHPHTKKIIVKDDCARNKDWRSVVALAAKMACAVPLSGPLILKIRFLMPRPKGHFGKKGLRASAPQFPITKPDATKLLRALEDACKGILFGDDAQIVRQIVWKEYAGEQGPGAVVELELLTEESHAAL